MHAAGHTVGPAGRDDIVGYRAFLAIVLTAYATIVALTPRTAWDMGPESWRAFIVLGAVYAALGIWGFELARRKRHLVLSIGYLLTEFGLGLWLNELAPGGMLPLILLPLAAQAVTLLPRAPAAVACALVIAGVSGNLTWVPDWPQWLRNVASASAAVVFVVVYVGVAQREREARHRAEALAAEVAHLAAANERTRMSREIHDTLGHYLTVIHVQLEAAKAVLAHDPARGLHAVNRAQALAKDGLTAVRASVKALREDAPVEGLPEQLRSLVDAVRDDSLTASFQVEGMPRPVSAPVALALHRTVLEALTNVRRHAAASRVEVLLAFGTDGHVRLTVTDNGDGAATLDTGGYGLTGIRERSEQLGGRVMARTSPGQGFQVALELPA